MRVNSWYCVIIFKSIMHRSKLPMLNFFYEHRKLVSMVLGSITFAALLRFLMSDSLTKPTPRKNTKAARTSVARTAKKNASKKQPAKKVPRNILVYITGEVVRPGVYKLSDDATILQLVEKAGGFNENADMYTLNFSDKVTEGGHVHIGTLFQEDTSSEVPAVNIERRININSATQKELESLPGIDSETAQRIINFRKAKGDFATPEALTKVRGISHAKLQNILPLIKAERTVKVVQQQKSSKSSSPASSLVDINTASVSRLDTLPGISLTLARRIVDYRNTHGLFRSPEELLKVSGMNRTRLERIIPHITLNQFTTRVVSP